MRISVTNRKNLSDMAVIDLIKKKGINPRRNKSSTFPSGRAAPPTPPAGGGGTGDGDGSDE